ncbi:putative calpain-like cysteine peptidase [Trypanosoma theileri]|uniref:Putative calpain-like cysteine peptidase n=1 Tax=Trypanosoma theileri TaxID=67003 RepID=A0A1X0NWJ3_9TRYP|nr:putative calpain-like cysteine peptidase [Trypanosoma theileri]ORC89074.1 putative calpain-like cysteine peptidase [Trypanosoma theileri]
MLSVASRDVSSGMESQSAVGTPYNVQQLQSEFHALTPREAYRELCQRFQCHPISAVAAMFPDRIGQWNETTELNFSRLYVGAKGVRPVVELCKRFPALKSLNFANNYLTNDSVYFITRMAMFHPALERIELSGNEFISWTGGTYLAELVVRNTNMKEVGVRRTSLPQPVAESVFEQTRRNCVLAFHASGGTPKPSVHPEVIHLRAMKRYFVEIQQNGTVPASALVDGLRERMRILGHERDFGTFTEEFLEQLKARAPQERLTWEMFIVLLRLDGSEYDDILIKKLQRVFLEFNMEPSEGMEGFIEARDLAAIHARLYGEPISSEEVKHLCSRIGLDETMTIQWDEFMMIMYIRGPKEMYDALSWTRTPLEHPKTALYF